MAAVTVQSDFGAQVCHCFHCFPITSWQIDGETVEIVTGFIFFGSKITADFECSHEIKRCLLLGRKVMNNLDNILQSRDITLPTNVHLVKAVVFPVGLYWCESWTIKKAECQRIDALEWMVGSPCSPKDSQESSPTSQFKLITSWEINGETVETVLDFIFGGSKITAAMTLKDTYSLEEKLWPT